jgi:hypothetical protein
MNNLPSLTDFGKNKDEAEIVSFLEDLVFSSLHCNHSAYIEHGCQK